MGCSDDHSKRPGGGFPLLDGSGNRSILGPKPTIHLSILFSFPIPSGIHSIHPPPPPTNQRTIIHHPSSLTVSPQKVRINRHLMTLFLVSKSDLRRPQTRPSQFPQPSNRRFGSCIPSTTSFVSASIPTSALHYCACMFMSRQLSNPVNGILPS